MESSPQPNHSMVSILYLNTHTPMIIETVIPKKSVIEIINSFIIGLLFSKVEEEINRNRERQHRVTIDFTHLYHCNKMRTISECPGSFSFRSKLSNFYKKLDAFLYSYLKL